MKTLGAVIALFCTFVLGFYLGGKEKQTVGIKFDMPEEIALAKEGDLLRVEKVTEDEKLLEIELGFFGKN